MNIELSAKEFDLLYTLLSKEEAELKVEIHHCRNYRYKEGLKDRENEISSTLKHLVEATSVSIF